MNYRNKQDMGNKSSFTGVVQVDSLQFQSFYNRLKEFLTSKIIANLIELVDNESKQQQSEQEVNEDTMKDFTELAANVAKKMKNNNELDRVFEDYKKLEMKITENLNFDAKRTLDLLDFYMRDNAVAHAREMCTLLKYLAILIKNVKEEKAIDMKKTIIALSSFFDLNPGEFVNAIISIKSKNQELKMLNYF